MDWLFYGGVALICAFIIGAAITHGRNGFYAAMIIGAFVMFGWSQAVPRLPIW